MTNSITSKFFYAVLLLASSFMFASCGDEDPISDIDDLDVELPTQVITTYEGVLTYTGSDGNVISALDGEAEIIESGSSYRIEFSDGVPAITGLNFSNADGEYVSISGTSSVAGIVIDGDDLDIGVTSDDNVWAFSGSK